MTRQPRLAVGLLAALTLLLAALVPAAARAQRPSVEAPSAIVVETSSGRTAYGKDPDRRRPIASTTKLMTALLTLESGDLSEVVTVPGYDATPAESLLTPPLVAGEKLTVADLLRGMLLTSANDAASALAIHEAGSVPAFVRRMNRRAQQLGMTNTSFSNPIGLDRGENYSTARDLAKLALALHRNRFFARTVDAEGLTLRSGSRIRRIGNRNTLLDRFPWVNGVKTGHTQAAGWCMVSSARRKGVSVVAVELGAPSQAARDDVSVALLRYGLSRFVLRGSVVRKDAVVAQLPIEDRAGATLPVVAARTVRRVVMRGESVSLRRRLPKAVTGPVAYGQDVGKLDVLVGGRRVTSVTLRADLSVPAAGSARKVQDAVLGPWTLVVLGGVLLLGAALALLRRRPADRGREELREAEQT